MPDFVARVSPEAPRRLPTPRCDGLSLYSGENGKIFSQTWEYAFNRHISGMKYQNSKTLYGFSADVDGMGRRKSLSVSTGEKFIYGYDSSGHLSTETRSGPGLSATTTKWTYANARLQSVMRGSRQEKYDYDNPSQPMQLTRIEHASDDITTFSYNPASGNLATRHRAVPIAQASIKYVCMATCTRTMALDGDIQGPVLFGVGVNEVTVPMNRAERLTLLAGQYDVPGALEISSIDVKRGTETYSFSGSAATTIGGEIDDTSLLLNAGGATASWSIPPLPLDYGHYEYFYDEQNRLKKARRFVDAPIVPVAESAFGYATIGWQMTSATSAGVTQSFNYGYQGELLKEDIALGNEPANSHWYVNAGVDQPLWSGGASGDYFYLRDVNGSVYGVANGVGTMLERQRYDGHGATAYTSNSGAPRDQHNLDTTLGYMGRTYFPGVGLYNFRHRFYDPTMGRFLTQDPLGDIDGPNRYAFCGGDPVNRVDPMGTDYIYQQNGYVFYQGQTRSWGMDWDDGRPIAIGTTDGTWINLFNGVGGGITHYASLSKIAADLPRGPANLLGVRGVIGDSHGETFSETPWLDRGIGAANAGLEMPRLINDTTYAVGVVAMSGQGADTRQFKYDSSSVGSSSMLFSYVARDLEKGKSAGQVSRELAPTLIARTNPVTGLALGISDISRGEISGNYEQAGGGYLALASLPVAKAVNTVNSGGFRALGSELTTSPTGSGALRYAGAALEATRSLFKEGDQGPTIDLFHKGQLNNGVVSGNRSLSTGTNNGSVEALNRPGGVFTFRVPMRLLMEWEDAGLIRRFLDYDAATGVRNEEVRVLPPASAKLNQFKVD